MTADVFSAKLLLVDDEEEFRHATAKVLARRGFLVSEAGSGKKALALIRNFLPDVVVLDLKMPDMSGIETLQEIRKIDENVPVIILTGHGDLDTAMAGIKLGIVDFANKPIAVDALAKRIRDLLSKDSVAVLREISIAELMNPVSLYKKIYIDQSIEDAVRTIWEAFYNAHDDKSRHRSALVFDRNERFIGVVRFPDLLRLVIPPFLEDSRYPSYFTGMFLAQCKLIGRRSIEELIEDTTTIEIDAPLIEAVHLMVTHRLINLPVLKQGEVVGILRERDLISQIAKHVLG